MAGLTIVTWFWGTKYDQTYVEKLAAGVKLHLKQPHRFICITDNPLGLKVECAPIRDVELLKFKGCFVRLRLFDPAEQQAIGISAGDRIVCMDLDTVITGLLDPLFDRPESFVILQGANSTNPCPYNGSLFMLRAGEHAQVWSEFSVEAGSRIRFFEFPDDQGWFWNRIPNAAGWKAGAASGVWAFRKRGWRSDDELPAGARMVCFPGARDPKEFRHLPWIKQHWR